MFQLLPRLFNQPRAEKIVSLFRAPLSWVYSSPRGITLRSSIGASVILKTHEDVFRQCFASAFFRNQLAKALAMPDNVEIQTTTSFSDDSQSHSDLEARSNFDSSHTIFYDYFKLQPEQPSSALQPLISRSYSHTSPVKVDAGTQIKSNEIQAVEYRQKLRSAPAEHASPATSLDSVDSFIDERIENNMESSDIAEPVHRTLVQNSALTDFLEIVILPTCVKNKFQTDEDRIKFRHRIGDILQVYKPLTSAVFLALYYSERITNRIDTFHSFYWWFILCLLYAHQILDDFHTITIVHVVHFMNADTSFAKRRQRNGYKTLQYHLYISQVDWVYFLDYIRISTEGLSLVSAEVILQLIFQSLPTPSQFSQDELHNPLYALEKALEEDRDTIQQIRGKYGLKTQRGLFFRR
ncbi:hypothetical protein J3R30DRAFT_135953 [Lentinula aciculospora]|uniref:Uncharacterized protein n=1 Tax=Lentinula aciculospora TaxID=153920 RepID=A0A9W9AVL9_9AGAR|nr:hypothetical protein J3R30DRAFT_135953 [Lentinula aciculospora]